MLAKKLAGQMYLAWERRRAWVSATEAICSRGAPVNHKDFEKLGIAFSVRNEHDSSMHSCLLWQSNVYARQYPLFVRNLGPNLRVESVGSQATRAEIPYQSNFHSKVKLPHVEVTSTKLAVLCSIVALNAQIMAFHPREGP